MVGVWPRGFFGLGVWGQGLTIYNDLSKYILINKEFCSMNNFSLKPLQLNWNAKQTFPYPYGPRPWMTKLNPYRKFWGVMSLIGVLCPSCSNNTNKQKCICNTCHMAHDMPLHFLWRKTLKIKVPVNFLNLAQTKKINIVLFRFYGLMVWFLIQFKEMLTIC